MLSDSLWPIYLPKINAHCPKNHKNLPLSPWLNSEPEMTKISQPPLPSSKTISKGMQKWTAMSLIVSTCSGTMISHHMSIKDFSSEKNTGKKMYTSFTQLSTRWITDGHYHPGLLNKLFFLSTMMPISTAQTYKKDSSNGKTILLAELDQWLLEPDLAEFTTMIWITISSCINFHLNPTWVSPYQTLPSCQDISATFTMRICLSLTKCVKS